MWTYKKTDRMILHAEMGTMDAFERFLRSYFDDRMPTVEEMSAILGVPVEMLEQVLLEDEEGE